jgi:hypothetical protein
MFWAFWRKQVFCWLLPTFVGMLSKIDHNIYNFGQNAVNKRRLRNKNEQYCAVGLFIFKVAETFCRFFIRDCHYFLPCNFLTYIGHWASELLCELIGAFTLSFYIFTAFSFSKALQHLSKDFLMSSNLYAISKREILLM